MFFEWILVVFLNMGDGVAETEVVYSNSIDCERAAEMVNNLPGYPIFAYCEEIESELTPM